MALNPGCVLESLGSFQKYVTQILLQPMKSEYLWREGGEASYQNFI